MMWNKVGTYPERLLRCERGEPGTRCLTDRKHYWDVQWRLFSVRYGVSGQWDDPNDIDFAEAYVRGQRILGSEDAKLHAKPGVFRYVASHMAAMYLCGHGVEKDRKKAFEYAEIAASYPGGQYGYRTDEVYRDFPKVLACAEDETECSDDIVSRIGHASTVSRVNPVWGMVRKRIWEKSGIKSYDGFLASYYSENLVKDVMFVDKHHPCEE